MSATKNIYAIYSNQDKDILGYFLLHLQPLQKDFNLTIWSDDVITPDQHWKPRDVSRLAHTDIFLLLLSNTFMYSEFIRQDEFKALIDRYKNGRATVIPVVVDNCPWDIEFTCDDYSFNFREIQVFPKNQKPIGDWNSSNEVFKEVTDYVRGLLTSPGKMDVYEEPHKISDKNIRNGNEAGQIAIDFFEERKGNDKAEKEKKSKNKVEAQKREKNNRPEEETQTKEVIIKDKKLRQKAEVQHRIEKEKELKGQAKKNKKIEVEAKLEEIPEEEKWGNEEAKAKEIRNGRQDIAGAERGSVPEKRFGEVLTAEEKVIRRNRLARYNYQFKAAKVVEAKTVVKEERRANAEARAQMAVSAKGGIRVRKPERDSELQKRLGEVITVQEIVNRKRRLTIHNYQFKPAKPVEPKKAVQEERRGNEEVNVQMSVEVKKHVGIPKSESKLTLEKKLGELVSTLKRTFQSGLAAVYKYKLKSADDALQGTTEAKKKKSTNEIGRIFSGFVVKLEKGLKDAIETLKRTFENGKAAVYNYKLKSADDALQGTTEAKRKKTTHEIRRIYPDFLTTLEKRLVGLVATLKRTFKNGWAAAYKYKFNWANGFQQGTTAEIKKKNTNRKRRIFSGFLIASLVICGLLIYVFTGNFEKQSTTVPEIEPTEVTSDAEATMESNSSNQPAAILKLGIGDTYKGGIVFSIDASNETGKIAYSEDMGPMPWKDAIKIHEQLGEGWRLPTLNELETMYRTIGQGADNVGRFADELYWSATPFDTYQARLLRFTDGNTSYHYNNALEKRKFLVRAIRDFNR